MILGFHPPDINAYPVLDEAAAEIPLAVCFTVMYLNGLLIIRTFIF